MSGRDRRREKEREGEREGEIVKEISNRDGVKEDKDDSWPGTSCIWQG